MDTDSREGPYCFEDSRESPHWKPSKKERENERMIPIIDKWCDDTGLSGYAAVDAELNFLHKHGRVMGEADYKRGKDYEKLD